MKKIGLFIFIGIIVVASVAIGYYNSFVTTYESVSVAQANIDIVLQRRTDLIPNLISTVKNFSTHETEVLDKVIAARQQLVNSSTMEEKAVANESLTKALGGLNIIVENYPELKSDKTYIALMDELAGSENRIAVARKDYNEIVQTYNNRIIRFPSNLIASILGFKKADYFKSTEDANKTPNVGEMLK